MVAELRSKALRAKSRDLDGDRLGTFGKSADRLNGGFHVVLAILLELVERRDHGRSSRA